MSKKDDNKEYDPELYVQGYYDAPANIACLENIEDTLLEIQKFLDQHKDDTKDEIEKIKSELKEWKKDNIEDFSELWKGIDQTINNIFIAANSLKRIEFILSFTFLGLIIGLIVHFFH